jgi:DnaJ-class molecular chaperone
MSHSALIQLVLVVVGILALGLLAADFGAFTSSPHCRKCDGYGTITDGKCSRCGGFGRVGEPYTIKSGATDWKMTNWKSCPSCGGSGRRTIDCESCLAPTRKQGR